MSARDPLPTAEKDARRRCGGRHWFAYYGWVGSSAPVCRKCGAPNPRYDPDRDPFARDSEDDGCTHEWLDRPESDSRECLICGEEVFGG